MIGFFEFYVRAFAVALPLVALAILMIGTIRARLPTWKTAMVVLAAALFFGFWYAIAVPVSRAGGFNVPPTLQDPPIVLGFLFGGAFLTWALAWLTPLGRHITMATPLSAIAAFQIPRLMGGVFLVGWSTGSIPAAFAIPAGLGDVWAGIAGWRASSAYARGAPEAPKMLARANLIGIGDFAMAVVLGILTSEGFAHVLSRDAPNIINDYPLALFPAYFVPIFLGFHLISMSRMQSDEAAH